jgi:hypothetical protein
MRALLRACRAENIWPEYVLGDVFYGPGVNGDMLYEAGQKVKSRLPPADNWRPANEAAARIFEAYKRWVGEVHSIEDLVAQAIVESHGGPKIPEIATAGPQAQPSEVMLVDEPIRDVSPPRQFGTIVPELRGMVTAKQPGISAQPVGPIFVGDA